MKKVRPSSRSLFFKCTSSQKNTRTPVNTATDVARFGTAGHHVNEAIVDERGAVTRSAIETAAKGWDVDEDELARIVKRSELMWEDEKRFFPKPRAEYALRGHTAEGVSDVVSFDEFHATIGDWKLGYVVRDAAAQVAAYAEAFRDQHGMPREGIIRGKVFWVRDGFVENYEFTDEILDQWAARYRTKVQFIGLEYNPGPHCEFCRVRNTCKALVQYGRRTLRTMGNKSLNLADATDEELLEMRGRLKILSEVSDCIDSELKTRASQRPVYASDGSVYMMRDVTRKKLRPWKTIEAAKSVGVPLSDVVSLADIPKKKLETLIKDKAPRGLKKLHWEMFEEALAENDAIEYTTSPRLTKTKRG